MYIILYDILKYAPGCNWSAKYERNMSALGSQASPLSF